MTKMKMEITGDWIYWAVIGLALGVLSGWAYVIAHFLIKYW